MHRKRSIYYKIKNLTKNYKNKNKTITKALKNVSFILPNNGFVFVLGKSGSGKSTLLNLLGDLDSPTSGDILIDGESLYSFNYEQRREYKASYCGFIFQDYRLINELSVKENILLSLEIISDTYDKDNRLKDVLHKVSLDGYEDKMVNQLSGGEKQRVAIARALIKHPKIILCDEPTGNLDKNTSTQILNLLKEISKSCLIFMVSHDEIASLKYASRRLILEQGKIIKDEARNDDYKNECKIENGTLYLPFERNLNSEEKEKIKENIKNNKIKTIEQLNDGFKENYYTHSTENFSKTMQNSIKIEKNLKNKLLGKYFKNGIFTSILNSILFALLTILLILVQTFISFDSSKIVLDNIDFSNQKNLLISKTSLNEENNRKSIISFNEEEKKELFGENIKHYSYVSYATCLKKSGGTSSQVSGYFPGSSGYLSNDSLYVYQTMGTAVVDKDYLNNTFNNGEEIEVLAGELNDTEHPYGVILTDYLADSINYINKLSLSYQDMIGQMFVKQQGDSKFFVSAIIKTNYKERYKELFSRFDEIKNKTNFIEEYKKLLNEDIFLDFYSSIVNGENVSFFSINKDFLDAIKKDYSATNYVTIGSLYLTPSIDDDYQPIMSDYGNFLIISDSLKNYEMTVSEEFRSTIASVLKTYDIVGKKITLLKYLGNDNRNEILSSVEVEIVETSSRNFVSKNLFLKIKDMNYVESGCVIPLEQYGIEGVISKVIEKNYDIYDMNSLVYTLVYKTLTLYTSTFELFQYILMGIILFYFSLVSVKGIKEFKYQIGVFKSLGMSDSNIYYIFLGKNIIFSLISCLLIFILSFPFLYLANVLLMTSYSAYIGSALKYMSIFYFHPNIYIFNFIFVILVILISSLLPLLLLKKVTPAKIVNTRED